MGQFSQWARMWACDTYVELLRLFESDIANLVREPGRSEANSSR